MTARFSQKNISLPKDWTDNLRSAILFVISLAHLSIIYARGLAASSRSSRVRHKAEVEHLQNEVELKKEEMRIKDARMARLNPRRRPYYPPAERMAILELMSIRGWSQAETARRFLLKPTTIASWLKRVDVGGASALLQVRDPVNKFPGFVRYIVKKLKLLCPSMGKKRIAQVLARAGLHLGVTTVRRMLKERSQRQAEDSRNEDAGEMHESDTAEKKESNRLVKATYPNHVWNVDLTAMPLGTGFWVPWIPFSLPQVWPFAWGICCAVDHFSRRVIGFAVFKDPPTSEHVRAFLGRAIAKCGAAPKYLISDSGPQFLNDDFKEWCRSKGIRPRYGAVGQHGSIALIERFFKSLKNEWLRCILISFRIESMRKELTSYSMWFNQHRPHQSLGGRTPLEVYEEQTPANEKPRFEPRSRWPRHSRCARPQAQVKGQCGVRLELVVKSYEGRKQLPVVELKEAA
jgi:putative transposase